MKNAIKNIIKNICKGIENQKKIDQAAVAYNSAFINYAFGR